METTLRRSLLLMGLLTWLGSIAMLLMSAGCATQKVDSVISATGTQLQQAHAHLDSAESDVQKIKPHADKTGQELVDIVDEEQQAAERALVQAEKDLQLEQTLVTDLKKNLADMTASRDKYKNSWGYRAEVVILSFLTLLVTLAIVHVVAGGLAVVLPLFFPAAIAAVPILKLIGAFSNPFAWVQYIFDHVHLARCVKPAAA